MSLFRFKLLTLALCLLSAGPAAAHDAAVSAIASLIDPAKLGTLRGNLPLAVEPALDREIANLELLPRTLNRRKGASMGARQWDYLEKFRRADLLQPVFWPVSARLERRRLNLPLLAVATFTLRPAL